MAGTCVFMSFSYFSICFKYFRETKLPKEKNIFSGFSFSYQNMNQFNKVFMLFSLYCVVCGVVMMPL